MSGAQVDPGRANTAGTARLALQGFRDTAGCSLPFQHHRSSSTAAGQPAPRNRQTARQAGSCDRRLAAVACPAPIPLQPRPPARLVYGRLFDDGIRGQAVQQGQHIGGGAPGGWIGTRALSAAAPGQHALPAAGAAPEPAPHFWNDTSFSLKHTARAAPVPPVSLQACFLRQAIVRLLAAARPAVAAAARVAAAPPLCRVAYRLHVHANQLRAGFHGLLHLHPVAWVARGADVEPAKLTVGSAKKGRGIGGGRDEQLSC
jgi:hypothetical protein